jgi:hypothetical protein
MGSGTGRTSKDSESSSGSGSESKSNGVPATLSGEELTLGENVAVRLSDDLVSSVVAGINSRNVASVVLVDGLYASDSSHLVIKIIINFPSFSQITKGTIAYFVL